MDQTLEDAARAQAAAGDFAALASTLGELSSREDGDRLAWAAQSAWLASSADADLPASDARSHFENLFIAAAGLPALQRLLAAKLMWLAMPGGGEAHNPDAAINATYVARKAAEAAGVETQEQFGEWLHALLSSDAAALTGELREAIDAIVGDRWIFDRSLAG